MPLDLQQLQQFPIQSAEWRVAGLARLPVWVNDHDGKPMRPWIGICTGPTAGVDLSEFADSTSKNFHQVLEALIAQGRRLNTLPGILHVWDAALAEYLQGQFQAANLAIGVEVHPKHPIIDQLLKEMAAPMMQEGNLQGMLSGKGVTLERIAAFAAAAAEFYKAAPWKLLNSDEDLLKVASPKMTAEMAYAVVLGSGNQEFGIGFFRSPKDFQEMCVSHNPATYFASRTVLNMTFAQLHEIPIEDADLWEDHKLPLVEGCVPLCAIAAPRRSKRLDSRRLALLEGLLRVLAQTTREDIAAGQWSREISTADGVLPYTLAFAKGAGSPRNPLTKMRMEMERIMRQMQESGELDNLPDGQTLSFSPGKRRPARASDARERAVDLTDEAWDAPRRKACALAQEALTLWPDHADAYNILAQFETNPAAAADLYRRGAAAGQRALGPKAFEELAGRFWGFHETRPYMRARHGLAISLWTANVREEAIEIAQDMLRLNPNDNQGVRYELICWLLINHQDREAAALLKNYEEDGSPWWLYGKALLSFRLGGDSPDARHALKQAIKSNRFAPPYLSGMKTVQGVPPEYSPGDLSEALCCAEDLAPAWQANPAAIAWLEGQTARSRKK